MGFCDKETINTGVHGCDIVPGKPVLLIFAPKEVQLSEADKLDPLSFFESAVKNNNPALRALPVSGIAQNDANNVDANMSTLSGYGYAKKLADAAFGDIFQFPMSICKAKALKMLDGYSGRVFILTDNGIILGSKLSNGNVAGIPLLNVSVSSDGFHENGQNIVVVKITTSYGSETQILKNIEAVSYSFDADEIEGITSLALKKVGALTYQVVSKCSGVNLYGTHADALAAGALWKVTNLNTGATVALSTVTKVADKEAFLLTPSDALGAPYKIGVTLADLSTLSAAGVVGFEQAEVFVDNVTA